MGGGIGGWMDGWMGGWMGEWMDGWMDGWVEWNGEWVGEWMDKWVNVMYVHASMTSTQASSMCVHIHNMYIQTYKCTYVHVCTLHTEYTEMVLAEFIQKIYACMQINILVHH